MTQPILTNRDPRYRHGGFGILHTLSMFMRTVRHAPRVHLDRQYEKTE